MSPRTVTHRSECGANHPPHLHVRDIAPSLRRSDDIRNDGKRQRNRPTAPNTLQAPHNHQQSIVSLDCCAHAAGDVNGEADDEGWSSTAFVGQASDKGGSDTLEKLPQVSVI